MTCHMVTPLTHTHFSKARWKSAESRASRCSLAPHAARGLILAQPLIHDLAEQPVGGPGQKGHFGDELGCTQCTRDNSSGRPKRAVGGGGRSTVLFFAAGG